MGRGFESQVFYAMRCYCERVGGNSIGNQFLKMSMVGKIVQDSEYNFETIPPK